MVAALRASGETPEAFAERHGIHEARVLRWVRRVARELRSLATGQPVTFAAVPVTAELAPSSRAGLEVVV